MINLNIKNFKIINLILALIIPLLVVGPFFPDLIVSLSSLFFLYYVFKYKKFNYFQKIPITIFFIFCIYCILLSIFFAKNSFLSFESSLFYFRIGVFACFIWFLIEKDNYILLYFYYVMIGTFLLLVIDGYIQFFFGSNLLGYPIYNENRISSFFGDELILGSFLSRLFPLLLALFIIKKKRKYEIYFIGIFFILIELLIYISGDRTAFFFLNLSSFFIIILINKYQKFRLITFFIALFLISILIINNDNHTKRMFIKPAINMGLIDGSKKKYVFTQAHDNLYRTAFNMFKDKPIFGYGPKMFRVICKEKKYAVGKRHCNTHPHNFYIQLLAETGIIGTTFLLTLLAYVIYCFCKQLKCIFLREERYLTDYQVCLLSCIFITVWPFSPNGNFFNNWLAICYSLPFGFYLQSIYGRNKNKLHNI